MSNIMFDMSSEGNDLSLSVTESPSKVLMHGPQEFRKRKGTET